MQACSKCIMSIGLKIEQPQLLQVVKGCDNCLDMNKKSFDIMEIVKQALVRGK